MNRARLILLALIAAFAFSGLSRPAQALPAGPIRTLADSGNPLVEKVHGYHCAKRYGWYRGHKYRHRHAGACRRIKTYYYPYRYYYPRYTTYYYGPSIYLGYRSYRHNRGYRIRSHYNGRKIYRGRVYRRNVRRHFVR